MKENEIINAWHYQEYFSVFTYTLIIISLQTKNQVLSLYKHITVTWFFSNTTQTTSLFLFSFPLSRFNIIY